MNDYQKDFIEFMVRCQVLRFGDFIAKSGRKTPYFVDTGRYRSGTHMDTLGRFYARTILEHGLDCTLLFGPAYKGIPLVVATAIALQRESGRNLDFCFNRKEVKDHGEGGIFVGRAPTAGDRVLILEDVTTAGTSIRETVPLLLAPGGVQLAGLVVGVDRMERGQGNQPAFVELQQTYGMPCAGIVNIRDILEYLHGRRIDGQVIVDDKQRAAVEDYLARYGGQSPG